MLHCADRRLFKGRILLLATRHFNRPDTDLEDNQNSVVNRGTLVVLCLCTLSKVIASSVHINNNCFFVKKGICLPEEPLTFLQIHIVDSQSKSKSYQYYLRVGKCQEISRVFKRYESTGEKLNISPGQQFNIVT